jgi:hypothetical protein
MVKLSQDYRLLSDVLSVFSLVSFDNENILAHTMKGSHKVRSFFWKKRTLTYRRLFNLFNFI